jgi:hypothetical protein
MPDDWSGAETVTGDLLARIENALRDEFIGTLSSAVMINWHILGGNRGRTGHPNDGDSKLIKIELDGGVSRRLYLRDTDDPPTELWEILTSRFDEPVTILRRQRDDEENTSKYRVGINKWLDADGTEWGHVMPFTYLPLP